MEECYMLNKLVFDMCFKYKRIGAKKIRISEQEEL